jgi:hypothetical protein
MKALLYPVEDRSAGELPVHRLAWGVVAKTDESLMGLSSRSCADHLHQTTEFLLSSAGAQHHRVFNLAINPTISSKALAYVLCQPIEEVIRRLHDVVPSKSSVATRCFFSAHVADYDLILRDRLVSPSALAHSVHHRALHQHGLLPFCHETGDFLIGVCPRCDRKLGWYWSLGIERCDNFKCGFDLRDAEAKKVDAAMLERISPLAKLLDPRQDVHAAALASFDEPLRHLNRGALFELAWRVGWISRTGRVTGRDSHKKLPVAEIVATLDAGVAGLRDWPARLEERVVAAIQAVATDEAGALARAYRRLATGPDAWDEHRAVVRQTAPQLMLPLSKLVCAVTGGLASKKAAAYLGIDPQAFLRLQRGRFFKPLMKTGTFSVLPSSTLEPLRRNLQERVPIGAAAERLGTTLHAVEQLICLGRVTLINDAALRILYKGQQITRSTLCNLQESLKKGAGILPRGVTPVPLTRALMLIGGREKPWGPVIALMLDGQLRYSLRPGKKRIMKRLLVHPDDVAKLLHLHFDRGDHNFDFATTMPRRDAQELLNLTAEHIGKAIADDLPHATTNSKQLLVEPLLHMAAERISAGEILARWGKGRRMPELLQDRQRFPRLAVTGWARRKVELALRGENKNRTAKVSSL